MSEKKIQIKKVQDFEPVVFSNKKSKNKFYGSDDNVFPNSMLQGYPIFYCCSSKFSGKTFVTGQIILKFINPKFKDITHIHWITNQNTQQNDQTYIDIKKYLEKNKYRLFEHQDESKEYLYKKIIPMIERHNNDLSQKRKKQQPSNLSQLLINATMNMRDNQVQSQPTQEEEDYMKLVQEYKKQSTRQFNNILIYDDIQFQGMRKNGIDTLCKQIRHYKTLLLLSSQYIRDVNPQIFSNLSYILFWKNINKNILKQIFYMLNLPNELEFDDFLDLYNWVTNSEKYNFLMINRDTQQMFKNWTHQILIEK